MRLLLDEHVAPAVARGLRRHGLDAVALVHWQGSQYLGASDPEVLAAAALDQHVLLTYDLRSIPELLREWSELGRQHAGVVLVDEQTIRPSDVGGLVRVVAALATARARTDWAGRVELLRRAGTQ